MEASKVPMLADVLHSWRMGQCDASLIPDRPFRISYKAEIMIFRYIYGSNNLAAVILPVQSNIFHVLRTYF